MIEWLPWLFIGAMAIFAMGWLVARVDIKQLLLESRAMPQAYFKGLNFLLNEQPDQAIESFIEVTKANPEAVELQFALGSLFRRRGEVDRAIRVHQELSERTDLATERRTRALIELAIDYQKAGLLDHAERILVDMSSKSAGDRQQQLQTLRLLLDIHVQERNWVRAIDVAGRLQAGGEVATAEKISSGEEGVTGKAAERDRRAVANFHCELAIEARREGRHADAERHLADAINANAKCVRAHLIQAEFFAADGQHRDAIVSWRKIEQQEPAFLGLMAERILTSYDALGEAGEGLGELSTLQTRYPTLDMLDALFNATLAQKGPHAACEWARQNLQRHPTLAGLEKLYEAEFRVSPENQKAEHEVLRDLVHHHASRLSVYLCGSCGFKAKQYYWQCPACSGWETFPPRLTAEYDMADRQPVRVLANK